MREQVDYGMPRRAVAPWRSIATALLVQVVVATAASAAEGGESNLFAGDIGNAVWTLVIFLVLLAVLGKFAWGPLLSTLQQRETFIRDSLLQAKKDREEAEARLAEYTEKLSEARGEATAIVEEGRRDAEVVKGRIEEEARAEADKMIERAKREIQLAQQTAIKDLYEVGGRLATEVASKVIRREISAADHERLIAESIQDLLDSETN